MDFGIKFRLIPRGLFSKKSIRNWAEPTQKGILGYRPFGTKPKPSPKPPVIQPHENRYGDNRTIHSTGEVNVEIGPTGDVVAVWFRCRMLPFTQMRVIDSRASSMLKAAPLAGIKAIVFDKDFPNDG
jgi:hypothetical protein